MTAAELRSIRSTLGLTQAGLATRLGFPGKYSAQAVSRWERGEREIPGPVTVALLLLLQTSPASNRPA